jgi:hypothetical protein
MNIGIVGTRKVRGLPHCRCGRPVTVRYAERHGEGEHPSDGHLCGSRSIEAWIDCEQCGWVSALMDTRNWSEERFDDDPLTTADIAAAISGACKAWQEQHAERT